ncbi:MAG: betaine/proline/choline family ABC transporter ATP-binding protein [Kiloniellales bacterium]
MTAKLQCTDLWKVYGSNPESLFRGGSKPSDETLVAGNYIGAVRDAAFEVHEGEILVLMGLSGSGKSTLLRCLSRLIEPTAGAVHFEGQDITHADEKTLRSLRRHKMGMVFQNFGLLPHRTALENVIFPLEVQGFAKAERMQKALELIKLVGLEGRETYYPRELSGGQQQRVGIARSLAVEPDVWFLDEPFSALDPLIRREMQDEFIRLQRNLKKTIVFVTHDFEEAVRLADRIAIMRGGIIVQLGTPEELVVNPADDYVAEFTKTAPKAKLIRAQTVMQPLSGFTGLGNDDDTVPGSAPIETAAPTVLGSKGRAIVIDEQGRPIGELTREHVIDVLFGEQNREDEKANDPANGSEGTGEARA